MAKIYLVNFYLKKEETNVMNLSEIKQRIIFYLFLWFYDISLLIFSVTVILFNIIEGRHYLNTALFIFTHHTNMF